MHNNHYVSSTVSLRCRGSLSFSFNDYPCFLDDRCVDRSPILFPPSSCCACCDNNFSYRVPINPIFLCGWRQSTLIQWSPGRRLILDGVNQCYSRLPVCDANRKCSYGKSYTFKERSIIGRRGKWGKNGRYGCNVDDAEVILSLLTEEEGEGCFDVRQRNGGRDRNVRRVQLEKREKNRGDSSYKSKKKAVESCALESTSKREFEYVKFQPSEEDSRPNEDRREENMEIFSRGESRRARNEGSSCSSYYSFSSSGEFGSDSKIQAKCDGFRGDSSNGYERDHRESRYDGEVSEEVDRHRSYVEEQGVVLRNENTVKGLHAASSGIDYDLRKKSEKKLNEELTEQTESWKESSEKHSRLSDVHGSGYAKSSSSHKQYDDRKEKSSLAVNIDEAMRQQHRQAVQRISGQSESRLKYKQFTEMPEIHDSAVETTSSSQKQYRGREENLLGSSIFVQETARERLKTDGLVTREEKHRRNSQQLAKSLEIREIDNSETSISHRLSDTRMKNQEGDATMVPRLVDDSVEQHYQAGHRVTTQMGSRGEFQQLMGISNTQNINNQNTFISQRKSEVMNFHKDMSEEAPSSPSSLKLDSQSMVHQVGVNKENKTSSNATVRAQLHVEPISGLGTYDFRSEGIESGSSALHVPTLEGSPALQHEIYGTAGSETHGGSVNSVSHEDAIGSAARLQKFSMHFVGEFVEKVRHEGSTSEVQKETRTYNTKLVHEGDPHEQKGRGQYSSGDSEMKDHDSRRSSRGSGTKGPSDEMWDVTDPFIQESLKTEIPEATSTTGNGAVKRTGRSLWSVISDIVRLRWASRSESNNSRSGGKHSPNQSTSSEAWFSGHEPDENNDENMKQGRDIVLQKSSSVDQKQLGEILGQSQGEASSSKRSKDKIKHVDLCPPSPSNIESGSAPKGILSPAVEEAGPKHYEGTSSGSVIAELLNPLPTIRMRRSHPIVQEISEAGKTDASGSGTVVPIEKPVSSNLTKVSGAGGKIGELKQMKLQRSKQVLKDRFDEWEEAYTFETEQRKNDEMFMREALLEAKKAADIWEVPVGAVLVQHGKIIARGYNLVEELRDSTAHAEMICIREASNILRSWRLSETTLYVTLEPCPMCAGAILQARIDTIVWGAPNKLLGADGSWIRLFPNGGEGQSSSESTDKPAAPVHPFHPNVKIRRGVLTSECADVMQQFFQLRRRKKDKKPDPPTPPSPSSCLPISSHPSKFLNKMHDAFNIMFCL